MPFELSRKDGHGLLADERRVEGLVEQRPGTLEEGGVCIVGALLQETEAEPQALMLLEGFWGSRQQELARREEHAGVDQACGGVPLYTSSCTPSPPEIVLLFPTRNTLSSPCTKLRRRTLLPL